MREVILDIETAPNLGYTWGKYQQDVLRFERESYIMAFAYKEPGKRAVSRILPDYKSYRRSPYDDTAICTELWDVLNNVDFAIGHNVDRFDIRRIRARCVTDGLSPIRPFKIIDTLKIARKYFNFQSNKLGDLADTLKIGMKVRTGGFDLWWDCMHGDMKQWEHMRKYCVHDIVLNEKIYDRLGPWHVTHPNTRHNDHACPKCGGHTQAHGWEIRKCRRVRRYQCRMPQCAKWSYGESEAVEGVQLG